MFIKSKTKGFTLVEALATVAIISVLAAGIMPLSRMMYKRTKEIQLRNNLRIIRTALDEFAKMAENGTIPKNTLSGFPEDLDQLIEGVDLKGVVEQKKKFLRRIPKDPMTEDGEWGLRSYTDASDSTVWGGQDVYDIYSLSESQAIDGTFYREW